MLGGGGGGGGGGARYDNQILSSDWATAMVHCSGTAVVHSVDQTLPSPCGSGLACETTATIQPLFAESGAHILWEQTTYCACTHAISSKKISSDSNSTPSGYLITKFLVYLELIKDNIAHTMN